MIDNAKQSKEKEKNRKKNKSRPSCNIRDCLNITHTVLPVNKDLLEFFMF